MSCMIADVVGINYEMRDFLCEEMGICFKSLMEITRSSATAKSTARPSCLVGVLYDIYRETNNISTANQPLVRNWPGNLPNSAK